MSELLQAARQIEAQIIEDRRRIHRCPEVGFELTETAVYANCAVEWLKKHKK